MFALKTKIRDLFSWIIVLLLFNGRRTNWLCSPNGVDSVTYCNQKPTTNLMIIASIASSALRMLTFCDY